MQEWILTSENGGNIQLTFESFHLEEYNCEYDDYHYTDVCTCDDYVEVSYGSYREKFCGNKVPETIISCGSSSMVIEFHSDSHTTGAGFRAEWEELPTTPICNAANCLTYPADYPCSYPNNADEVI